MFGEDKLEGSPRAVMGAATSKLTEKPPAVSPSLGCWSSSAQLEPHQKWKVKRFAFSYEAPQLHGLGVA